MIDRTVIAFLLITAQAGTVLAGEGNNLASVEIPASTGIYNTVSYPPTFREVAAAARVGAHIAPSGQIEAGVSVGARVAPSGQLEVAMAPDDQSTGR